MSGKAATRRGRPQKFGRPARLIWLTLPDDVIRWLGTMDADLARAVVKLHERSERATRKREVAVADLVQLPDRRALILVRPDLFRKLQGVSIIPLADGRGFLALETNRGVADLELAVLDRLEVGSLADDEAAALTHLKNLLKQWRHEGVEFESRSIIVARRPAPGAVRLPQLRSAGHRA